MEKPEAEVTLSLYHHGQQVRAAPQGHPGSAAHANAGQGAGATRDQPVCAPLFYLDPLKSSCH